MLSDADKAGMRERHQQEGAKGAIECPVCWVVGDCDAIRALDALDEAERRGDTAITRLNSVRGELAVLVAVLRYPDDEVVEAVARGVAEDGMGSDWPVPKVAERNGEARFVYDVARAAIAAMADALGVAE